MEDSWHQLQPKTSFLVRLADRLTDQSWQTLTQLYQPIIGPSAAGLYSALFWLPQRGDYHRHATLLAILGIDLSRFYNLRLRLEATGLLTTKVKVTSELTSFIYELQAPLLPADFFDDDLLSVQLLGIVGENLYQALVENNRATVGADDNEKNITKNFLDVFHVDGQELKKIPSAISAARAYPSIKSSAPNVDGYAEGFSFEFLGELLKKSFVDINSVQSNRDLLVTEHLTYGIDELTMINYIERATDILTNRFNPTLFKKLIVADFNKPDLRNNFTTETLENTAQQESNVKDGKDTRSLIHIAAQTAPAEFIQGIKKQMKYGYVTSGESWLVRELVGRRIFSNGVINILIYHILVDMEQEVIPTRLWDKLANDWSKKNVKTPNDAIQEIKGFQKGRAEKREKRRKKYSRSTPDKRVIHEKLPEWTKNNSSDPEKFVLTPEQKKEQKARQEKRKIELEARRKRRLELRKAQNESRKED